MSRPPRIRAGGVRAGWFGARTRGRAPASPAAARAGLGLAIRHDPSTAWKALAGICPSWSTIVSVQRRSVVPPKDQLLPLSATISP